MRISDWSSDVCSSDLAGPASPAARASGPGRRRGSCAPPLMREIIIAKPEEQHQRADAVAGERVGDKLAPERFEQPGGEQHHDHPHHHHARDTPPRPPRLAPAHSPRTDAAASAQPPPPPGAPDAERVGEGNEGSGRLEPGWALTT